MGRKTDPYGDAQFASLWQVVVHATEQGVDRFKVYAEAAKAMIADHQWRAYRMLFAQTGSGYRYHVGYRYANPRDWFILPKDGEVNGPFRSKKLCLRVVRAKSATKVDSGVYAVGDTMIFTRAQAGAVNIKQEVLP
jgi:hypothetical protein